MCASGLCGLLSCWTCCPFCLLSPKSDYALFLGFSDLVSGSGWDIFEIIIIFRAFRRNYKEKSIFARMSFCEMLISNWNNPTSLAKIRDIVCHFLLTTQSCVGSKMGRRHTYTRIPMLIQEIRIQFCKGLRGLNLGKFWHFPRLSFVFFILSLRLKYTIYTQYISCILYLRLLFSVSTKENRIFLSPILLVSLLKLSFSPFPLARLKEWKWHSPEFRVIYCSFAVF